jgi:hypothetical protein
MVEYRLVFDPIFYRVIIDFDMASDKSAHYLVDWLLFNKPGLPFFNNHLNDYNFKPFTKSIDSVTGKYTIYYNNGLIINKLAEDQPL